MYVAILALLGILTGVFIVSGLVLLNNETLQHAVYNVVHYAPEKLFAHSFFFAFVCLFLVILLLLSIKSLAAAKKFHSNQYHMFSSVLSCLNAGVLVLDSEKKVKYFNPFARHLLCRDEEDIPLGTPYTDLVNPLLLPVAERLISSIENSESFSREFRVFLPSGIRCVKCEFFTIYDENAQKLYLLTLEDKTKEDEIRYKLSRQLEETHRYAASRDNFFANMSHEIRTPINAILGMTYFAKKATTEPKCLGYIQKIENASDILLRIVNDILDFSKMNENKFSLAPEEFNLYDLRKVIIDLFVLKAEQKGLDFTVEFDCPKEFRLVGDQFRLTQIFMNLISNAIKFTVHGYITVFVNTEVIGNDVILRCSVRDTGCGLFEDDMANLFTDFEQFGQVLVKNHEGSGLGLAITKRLVELMHGVIWVDSEPGKGSVFHFVVVMQKQPLLQESSLLAEQMRVTKKTGRVLLVEDNEINREIAEAMLVENGCAVDHASDGLEAIDMCRSKDPDYYDLVLMDIHMPRMNGYDAARILKNELHITAAIMAVSATSENTDLLDANRDVISGYLEKPYSPEVFRAMFSGTRV